MLLEAHTRSATQTIVRPGQHNLQHVMIIADEPELAESLQQSLRTMGYQVSVINDGLQGLMAAKQAATDLIVVGWAPPRLSGLELCRRLRVGHNEEHIILLTQEDSYSDRIAGLRAGANDCISVPFHSEELIARIQTNLLRRRRKQQSSVLRCADIQLNRKTREVFRGDRLVRLTAREFDLLEYLMSHYFQVLTRAQILENVWGYNYSGGSNIIEVYIRYLRRKLKSPEGSRLIHTVRSVGYIFREEAVVQRRER